MPTYQSVAPNAAKTLEAMQKFSDAPLTTCRTCGGRLRKVFNAVGVVFKGSGFYRTDSRSGSANGDGSDSRSADKKANTETSPTRRSQSAPGQQARTAPARTSSRYPAEPHPQDRKPPPASVCGRRA